MPKSKTRKRGSSADRVDTAKRTSLVTLRNGAVALVALGGAGVFGTRAVQATMAEHDLTRIGNGRPSVVQIHDPNCALCTRLQRETRRALRRLGDDDLQYLVANILTDEGADLSREHNVPHVTLLLFNGTGAVQQVIRGPQEADDLQRIFSAYLQTSR